MSSKAKSASTPAAAVKTAPAKAEPVKPEKAKPAFDPNEEGVDTKVDARPVPAKPKKNAAPKKESSAEQEKFEQRLETAASKLNGSYDSEREALNSRTFPAKLGEVLQYYTMHTLDNLRSMEAAEANRTLFEPLPSNKYLTLATKNTIKSKKAKPKKKVVKKNTTTVIIKGKTVTQTQKADTEDEAEEAEEAEDAEEAEEAEETEETNKEETKTKTPALKVPVSLSVDSKLTLYYLFMRYVEDCQEVLNKQTDGGKSIKTHEAFAKAVVTHTPDNQSYVARSVVGIASQYVVDVESLTDDPYDKIGKVLNETISLKAPSYTNQANHYFRLFMQVLAQALAYEIYGLSFSRLQSVNMGMMVARLRDLDSRVHRYFSETMPEFKDKQDCSLHLGFFTDLVSFKNIMIPPLTQEEKEKRKQSRKKKESTEDDAENGDDNEDEEEADEDAEEEPKVTVQKRGAKKT